MNATDQLLAMEEIKQLKARYFRGMDTKDWALFRSVFTDDVVVDSSRGFIPQDYRSRPIEPGAEVGPPDESMYYVGADAFVEALQGILEGVVTVHHGHTPEIEILSEEEACGTWAMEDKLRWPPGADIHTLHGYGHYYETYRKVNGRWLIKTTRLSRVRVDITHG